MPIVFNGRAFAKAKEDELALAVVKLSSKPYVKAFTFVEDEGSVLYTKLKSEAATRIGISYEPVVHSLLDDVLELVAEITAASLDPDITGVMVQKPSKVVFSQQNLSSDFAHWWDQLVGAIDPSKDVDCLSPVNLILAKDGNPRVLPATVAAVVSILGEAKRELGFSDKKWKNLSIAIIGRSDIVGKPLSWILKDHHSRVELFGRDNLPETLTEFDIVISAAGVAGLITDSMIAEGTIVIDVGSPKGDIDFTGVSAKTSFITPVPGGVGPVTVVSLMENAIKLGV